MKLGKADNPDFQFGTMICHITVYPLTCNPDDVLMTQQEDLMRNCFSGDVQVKGVYPYYIKRYFERHGIEFEITQQDLKELREGTVVSIRSAITCPTASARIRPVRRCPATSWVGRRTRI